MVSPSRRFQSPVQNSVLNCSKVREAMYLQAEVSRCSVNSIRSGGLGCFQTAGQESSSVVVCCIGSAVCVYGRLVSVYGLQQCLCCVEEESTRVSVDTNSGEALRGAFDATCEHIDDAVACNHMV